MKKVVHLLLHNIRSTHNVGSILRTADAVGLEKVIMSGFTPTPLDRFGRARKDVAKVALGAETSIKWEYKEDVVEVIEEYKSQGFEVIALEQNENSVDYKEVKVEKPTLVILGNEPKGIEEDVLRLCDTIAEIPMMGKKESLNVSVATGVFLFRIFG